MVSLSRPDYGAWRGRPQPAAISQRDARRRGPYEAGELEPLTFSLDNHGLWLAFMVFMAARAVTLGIVYPRIERDVGTDA